MKDTFHDLEEGDKRLSILLDTLVLVSLRFGRLRGARTALSSLFNADHASNITSKRTLDDALPAMRRTKPRNPSSTGEDLWQSM